MPGKETPVIIGIKTRLNNLARQSGLHPTHASQFMYLAYLQEGFLRRLVRSAHAREFILSGGSLLARLAPGYQEARPSKDLDLLCRLPERSPEQLLAAVADVLQVQGEDDAIEFDPVANGIEALETAGPAGGWRVEIAGHLGRSHLALKLDVVWEPLPDIAPQARSFPMLLKPTLALPPILTYPLEALLSDKMAAMMERGERNSRVKDYLDLWLLATTRDFEGTLLEVALRATCDWQKTPFGPEAAVFVEEAFAAHPEQLRLWENFLARAHLTFPTPTLEEAIAMIRRLYLPVVTGAARGKVWRHEREQWEE